MREPSDSSFDDQPVQLREYLAVLRLRKWSIALIASLVVASALFFSARQTPEYESETRILVNPANLTVFRPGTIVIPSRENLGTEKELVASEPVALLVAEELGLPTTEGLIEGLQVDVVTDTEILEVAYRHTSPETAQARSQAFAEAYLEFRRQQALEDLLAATEADRRNLAQLEERLASVEEELARVENEAQRASLETDRALLEADIAQIEQDLPDADEVRVGQIVVPAPVPLAPVSPDHVRNGLLAVFVGLALGVGVAFLRERLDDRLRGRGDLEARAQAPVLAVIPRVASWRKPKQTPLISVSEPKSSPAEAYRTLRTALSYLAAQEGVRTVLVTSPHTDEGKTATTANLGVALANAGKRVVVVGGDLRKPRLHRFFGLPNEGGLSVALQREGNGQRPVVPTEVENLWMVPGGPVPARPAELLGSEQMGRFLEWLKSFADIVIVDAPPVLVVADALTLAPLVDAVLLVADSENTTRGAITHAREQLAQVDARVIGAVLNNFDPSKAKAYPYYYRYYYTYRYEEVPAGGNGNGGGFLRRKKGAPAEG